MNEQPTAPDEGVPDLRRLWMAHLAGALMYAVVLLAMHGFADLRPVEGSVTAYTYYIGLALALPAIVPLQRFRRASGETALRRNDPKQIAGLRRLLVIGIGLGDLPAVAGIVHYVLSQELLAALSLCAITVALVVLFRPPAAHR